MTFPLPSAENKTSIYLDIEAMVITLPFYLFFSFDKRKKIRNPMKQNHSYNTI